MGKIVRWAALAGAVAAATALSASPAVAATDGGLGLEITSVQPSFSTGEPARLTMAVTNTSTQACGLTDVPYGTVQVTSVRHDGEELTPVLGRSFYLDGIEREIASGLVAADPGATVQVQLVGVRVAQGDAPESAFVRSVVATSSGTGLDTWWPVGAPGRYEVTALYAIPPVDAAIVPCVEVAAARTVAFTVGDVTDGSKGWPIWLWIAAAALFVLVVGALLIVVLVRRRRGGQVAAVAIVLLAATATATAIAGVPAKPAQASYEVNPDSGIPVPGVDFRGAVSGCFARFNAPGGDPAGIMDRLQDPSTPRVLIVPTDSGSIAAETPLSPAGEGSSTVAWNPTSTEPYGDGVARDPCAALYHELAHADDISRDSVPEGMCGSTGIPTAEVSATLRENQYRASQGLPLRTEYDGHRLPASMDECSEPPAPAEPSGGPERLCEDAVDCARSSGDPHLVTFDRTFYDFQAVGEFVMVRSTSGDALEVQVRQAAFGRSREVSVNSGVAFRLGGATVSLVLVGGTSQVHVDGEPVALARGETPVPGGGLITRRASDTGAIDGYDIRWPDGSGAAVDQTGPQSYRLLVRLDESRSGAVEGLLGNFDGDPSNDLALSTGTVIEQPAAFEGLYPSYADSWRITPDTSLFTYGEGESTQTFTDRGYPERPLANDDLDAAAKAQAERVCRWAGVTDPWLFTECVFDVAVTGRPEFAVGLAGTEHLAAPAGAPIAATPIAAGSVLPGGEDRLTFTGRAGDAVVVDFVAPTLPSRCSPLRLLDPSGDAIGRSCVVSGAGTIDRTVLPVDGEYSVLVEGESADGGRAMVRVYASQDVAGTIEPNGAPVSVVIEQPGSEARYQFSGAAGQRVYLQVLATTMPSQCSPLRLLDGEGRTLESGCLVGNAGQIDGVVLPADGAYTILVDANDRVIGSVHMRLFASTDEVGAITVDGPPVVATIGMPGAVARYEFAATAGTTVVLEVADGTLPSQCSPVRLLDAGGSSITSTCIFNGEGGLDATVLPETGTYSILVDPSAATTGSVTLTLRSG